MNSIGSRLRTLREQRKLTQVEVAAAVGTSRTNLTKIEGSDYAPGREVLMALAAYYDVSLDWIASGTGDPTAKSVAQNEKEALLLYAYRALPEDIALSHLDLMLKQAGTRKN